MHIRKTTAEDIPALMHIAEVARQYMKDTGNPGQWINGYPSEEIFRQDIENGASYVCIDDKGEVAGTYALYGHEPGYDVIYDGAWLNDEPYVVMHRVAALPARGTGTFMFRHVMAENRNVRIDTMDINKPMRSLAEKLGFKYCGIVILPGDKKRVAYHYVAA